MLLFTQQVEKLETGYPDLVETETKSFFLIKLTMKLSLFYKDYRKLVHNYLWKSNYNK